MIIRKLQPFAATSLVIASCIVCGAQGGGPLPGMPPVLNPSNIYSETRAGNLSPVVKNFPARIYVPNSASDSVDVIDPATFKVIDHFKVGHQPQHVVPSWDLKTLWVLNDLGDSLTKIDPATGKLGATVKVQDPYNMYYTPDGKFAIVVAEAQARLDFRDPNTMALVQSVPVACKGVDHIDFSVDGRYLIASCEFSGNLVKVDVAAKKVLGTLTLPKPPEQQKPMSMSAKTTESAEMRKRMSSVAGHRAYDMKTANGSMPQDVKLSPDGKTWYVADMYANGVYMVDGDKLRTIGFIPTGLGAHGLYPSRDAKVLYCSNRDEGTISIISFATRKVINKWVLPEGGSPDMGGVSADGKILWLSGRYNSEVYAIDTADGHLIRRIPVGAGPHGLCVYPQPGRYSLGHTGILR
jgi:YVTN family beta-propeller protein